MADFLERLIDGDALVVPDLQAHHLVPIDSGDPYIRLQAVRGTGGD